MGHRRVSLVLGLHDEPFAEAALRALQAERKLSQRSDRLNKEVRTTLVGAPKNTG